MMGIFFLRHPRLTDWSIGVRSAGDGRYKLVMVLVPTVSSSLLSVRASSITEMKWTSEILCLVFLVNTLVILL